MNNSIIIIIIAFLHIWVFPYFKRCPPKGLLHELGGGTLLQHCQAGPGRQLDQQPTVAPGQGEEDEGGAAQEVIELQDRVPPAWVSPAEGL